MVILESAMPEFLCAWVCRMDEGDEAGMEESDETIIEAWKTEKYGFLTIRAAIFK